MKKILLASICATLTGVSFGQGFINWGTITPTYFSAATNSTQYSSLSQALGGGAAATGGAVGGVASGVSGGPVYYYSLLYANGTVAAPTTTSALSAWSTVNSGSGPLMATNSSSTTVGRVASEGVAGTSLANLNNGTTYSVLMVGWSANLGSTWTTVENELVNWATAQTSVVGQAFFGESSVGAYNPGAAAPGNTPFGTVASGLINSPNTPLYVLATPEPTTMALVGVGGAALLAFRRKNK